MARKKRWTTRSGTVCRSRYERDVVQDLEVSGACSEYEGESFEYHRVCWYTPDVRIGDVYIEIKGHFKPSDRTKTLLVLEAHPGLDLRFLFMRDNFLSKTSKTTYTEWCRKHGIKCRVGRRIPRQWIKDGSK